MKDPSGTWYFVVDARTANGRRQQVRRRGFRTKKEASAAMALIVADESRGAFVRPTKETVRTFLVDDWLPTQERTLKPGTAHDYWKLITHYVVPHIGGLKLAEVDGDTINALYTLLMTDGRTGGSGRMGGLSAKTVRNVHGVLHKAFKDAVRLRRVPINPCDAADQPRKNQPEMKVWTPKQIQRFMAFVADDRHLGVWHLLMTTGMRRGEVLGLRWSEVDLEAGSVTIRRTTTEVDGAAITGTPKTRDSSRTLAIDAGTVKELKGWKSVQAAERLLMGAGWRDTLGMVVTQPDGAPTRPATFSRRFKALADKAGLPVIRLHDTRHSYATAAIKACVNVKVVQQRMGHSNIRTTLDLYAHVLPGDDQIAADVASAAIMGRTQSK